MNKTIILIAVILTVVVTAANATYNIVKKDFELYKVESACAMKQVMNGVARRDVKGCGKADYK